MAMAYKNVLGKWCFTIGRQDQKGRVFPANPELDNSRDLDSGLRCFSSLFFFFSLIMSCSGLGMMEPRMVKENRMKPKEVKNWGKRKRTVFFKRLKFLEMCFKDSILQWVWHCP